jgi:hypothetical protein
VIHQINWNFDERQQIEPIGAVRAILRAGGADGVRVP